MDDGSVLSHFNYFTVKPSETSELSVELRQSPHKPGPSGVLDLDRLLIRIPEENEPVSLESLSQGKSLVIILMDPGLEPSRHVLNDLGPYIEHFNRWKGRFIFLTPDDIILQKNALHSYIVPADHITGIDLNSNIRKAAEVIYGGKLRELPLVIQCDSEGYVFLFSAGYNIGIGEQLLRFVR
jgi:hypothetical protein